ncbi:hypothetical protein Tco_0191131 [Tanacetum coccineum]
MESSTSSHANQPYSPVNPLNLDMDFEQMFSQEYYPIQDYSMGHGSAHGSAHGSGHGSALVDDDDEDDSPVEEVSPVKPKSPRDVLQRPRRMIPRRRQNTGQWRKRSRCAKLGAIRQILKHQKGKWGKREEQQRSYIELKIRELEIQEAERRKAAELNREKLAIQRRMLELAEREKRDIDILFYNSVIDPSLSAIQQEKLLEIKLENKERYNLDY